MQPQGQSDRILDICKSFSQDFLNSGGNLQHCGRMPRCSDVEIIALCHMRASLKNKNLTHHCIRLMMSEKEMNSSCSD